MRRPPPYSKSAAASDPRTSERSKRLEDIQLRARIHEDNSLERDRPLSFSGQPARPTDWLKGEAAVTSTRTFHIATLRVLATWCLLHSIFWDRIFWYLFSGFSPYVLERFTSWPILSFVLPGVVLLFPHSVARMVFRENEEALRYRTILITALRTLGVWILLWNLPLASSGLLGLIARETPESWSINLFVVRGAAAQIVFGFILLWSRIGDLPSDARFQTELDGDTILLLIIRFLGVFLLGFTLAGIANWSGSSSLPVIGTNIAICVLKCLAAYCLLLHPREVLDRLRLGEESE